jgi:hypothetical protein
MNERYRYGYGDEPGERDATFSRQGSMTDRRDDEPDRAEADVEHGHGDEEDEERRADRIREADSQTQAAPASSAADGDRVADSADMAASTRSSSVFDVEEEARGADPLAADEPERAGAEVRDERPAAAEPRTAEPRTAEPRTAEPASDSEERPPIALGPPARSTDEAAAPTAPPAEPIAPGAPRDAAPAAATPTPSSTTTPGEETSIFETAGTAKPEAANSSTRTPTDETPAAVSSGVETPEPQRAGTSGSGTETEMLVPGAGPAPVAAPVAERSVLLGSIDPEGTRARFLDIQAGFVDEPRQAVQEAERFVDELVQGLVRALEIERAKLKATIDDGSTEDLRIALRGYRAFVDRLLNLTV